MTEEDLMEEPPKTTRDAQIDANLKRAYEGVLNEAVPEKLKALLEELRAQDTKSSGSDKGGGDQ